jgi:hypothetical protein
MDNVRLEARQNPREASQGAAVPPTGGAAEVFEHDLFAAPGRLGLRPLHDAADQHVHRIPARIQKAGDAADIEPRDDVDCSHAG